MSFFVCFVNSFPATTIIHCTNTNTIIQYVLHQPNNSSNNSRGRFLLGRPILRRQQEKKSNKPSKVSFRRPSHRATPRLSPLKETQEATATTTGFRLRQPQQQVFYSKSPIATDVDETGFSRAELYDLEESFKLFDVYGEGSIQVGDLKGILEVLQQEQDTPSKYSNLETLLDRLSELEDEDTLDLNNYIQLMASTTIGNSILIENGGESTSQDQHFSRIFALFDSDGKGYITLRDLETIAIELGEHDMTRGELQEMIDRAIGSTNNTNNKEGGGEKRVGIDEFTKVMTMSLFPTPSSD